MTGVYRAGNKWGVDYREPGGRRVRKVIGTRRQAETVAAKIATELFEGSYFEGSRRRAGFTFEGLKKLWLSHAKNKASLAADQQRFGNILAYFGHESRIDRVKPSDVITFRTWLEKQTTRRDGPPSPATVNRHLSLLRAAYNLAVGEKYVRDNPVSGKQFHRENNERDRICSESELAMLLGKANAQLKLATILGYETGMSLGEVVALRWKQIDLKARVIKLPHFKTRPARVVPLSQRAHDALEAEQSELRRINGRLFDVLPESMSSTFADLVERCGIEDLTFHDLRHTAATRMRRAGVDLVTLKKIFGWLSWKTMERYQNVGHDDLREAMARMDKRG